MSIIQNEVKHEVKHPIFIGVRRILEDRHEDWIKLKFDMDSLDETSREAGRQICDLIFENGETDSIPLQSRVGIEQIIRDLVKLRLREVREIYLRDCKDPERIAKSNLRCRDGWTHSQILTLIEMTRGMESCLETFELEAPKKAA